MPKGYNLGIGISQGVSSFVQSFMQARQMKEQEKLRENAFLVQVLTKQLEDETMPLFQRAKILDSIPPLIGIKKMDKRLSEMFGMDEAMLNEPQEAAVASKQGTSNKDLVDTSITDPSLASSIKLKGTQATSEVPASLERKGDLSPALIRKKLNLEIRKAEDVQDYDKQAKLLKLNFDLQMDSLKGNGFSKELFRGYDKDGNYIITLANQKGETKNINLGDVDSEAITKAGITGNKPSIFVRDREKFWLTQNNPETGQNYSEEEANIKALEDANTQFKLKQRTGEAFITGQQQRVAGTVPIQPAQSADDRRAIAERKATLRANINTVKRQALDASLDAKNKSLQANDQWNNVVEPTKREMQKLIDDGYETTSPEYRGLQTKLNTEIDRYNDLKRVADDADARDKSLKDSQKEAEDILKEYESSLGSSTNTIPDNIKNAIQLIRTNNPTINDPSKPNYMTDEAIINYLKKKGMLK